MIRTTAEFLSFLFAASVLVWIHRYAPEAVHVWLVYMILRIYQRVTERAN